MAITITLEWLGVEELVQKISRSPAEVRDGLRSAINWLRPQVVGATPWVTGRTATAWSSVQPADGGYSFGNPLPHILDLEYGYTDPKTGEYRTAAGPSTVLYEGRVYSKQAPGGIVGPLVYNPQVQEQLIEMVMSRVIRALDAKT